jgi:hypothetical protein
MFENFAAQFKSAAAYVIGRTRQERINRFEALLIGITMGAIVFITALENPAAMGR